MHKHFKPKRHILVLGLLAAVSIIWLIVRTGRKPTRINYPCQRAALTNVHFFLLALVAPVLGFSRVPSVKTFSRAINSKLIKVVLLMCMLLFTLGCAFNWTSSTQYTVVPVPLELKPQRALTSLGSSDLYFIENASGAYGSMDMAMSRLLELMGNHSLFFFRTASEPSGLIGKEDVVIIKVNCQWNARGGTNTDLVKSIIKKIVAHPEGFVGEIVVADNGQGIGSLDWGDSNAFNHSQSLTDVVNQFSSFKVSTYLWDSIRSKAVNEYDQGDYEDGYVVNSTENPVTHLRLSYPKFTSQYNTSISFKEGVWDSHTQSYSRERLKVINVPVLKSHGNYGVTACVKHYMGVVSQLLSSTHSAIRYGALGEEMSGTTFPTLNILDAIWVNANPRESGSDYGPSTSYAAASFTNVIGASQDPVALEYWASKYILIPAAISRNHPTYSSLDPDYEPITPGLVESYHTYLEKSMIELENAGFQVTMTEAEMNVHVAQSSPPEILGDIDGDHDVDIYDIVLIASSYGTEAGDPRYDVRCDLDGDEDVDIFDVVIAADNYGKSW